MALDFDKVKKLHEMAGANDKAEISVLHSAVLEGMNAYKAKATAANKKNWDAAKEGLEECVARLWPKYFPGEGELLEPEIFTKQKDALEYLKNRGCKLSAGKFSKDWRNGAVRLQKDKSVTRADLLAYAATLDLDQQALDEAQRRAARKDELEIEERELRVEKLRREKRKDDRDWLHRETVHEREGALIGQLLGEIRFQLGKIVPAVITISKGDHGRKTEVASALDEAAFAAFRALYETGEVDIVFEEDEE